MTRDCPPEPVLDAERAVLGAMLVEPEAVAGVQAILAPGDFYLAPHAKAYAAVLAMHDRGDRADLVTLADELGRRGELDIVGGRAALTEIIQYTVTTANVVQHATIVKEASRNRAARRAVLELHGAIERDPARAVEVLRGHTGRIDACLARVGTGRRVEVAFSEVAPERLEWLWHHRIPRGMVTLLAGDGGLGKSTVMLDIAARVTTGRTMPDGTNGVGPAGVIWLGTEDAAASVLVPRLMLHEADLYHVWSLRLRTPEGDERDPVITTADLNELATMIHERQVVLVVIDPLVAFVDERTNLHHNQDARRVMARLHALAERHRIAVVGIHHLNRGQHADAIHRLTGSAGLGNASRSALIVGPDPEDTTSERRVLALAKHNLAPASTPSLMYRLIAPEGAEHPMVEWNGPCRLTANELMSAPTGPEVRSERDEASEFLRELLSGGPVRATVGGEQARALGIAERTLKRARTRLGVQAYRPKNPGPWYWRLPDNEWPSGPLPSTEDNNNSNNREIEQRAEQGAKCPVEQSAKGPEGHKAETSEGTPVDTQTSEPMRKTATLVEPSAALPVAQQAEPQGVHLDLGTGS